MGFFDHRNHKSQTIGSFLGDMGRTAKKIGEAHIKRAVGLRTPKPQIRNNEIGGFGGMKQSLHARPPPILHSNGIVGHRVR
tara:strand:- start:1207 stop:1449 length:243 start_codon:yes stop_codon:yes gene_type:complete